MKGATATGNSVLENCVRSMPHTTEK